MRIRTNTYIQIFVCARTCVCVCVCVQVFVHVCVCMKSHPNPLTQPNPHPFVRTHHVDENAYTGKHRVHAHTHNQDHNRNSNTNKYQSAHARRGWNAHVGTFITLPSVMFALPLRDSAVSEVHLDSTDTINPSLTFRHSDRSKTRSKDAPDAHTPWLWSWSWS